MGDYGRDLAYVHDAAFLELARAATPAALGWLKGAGVEDGLVVELGCGSGETAARLVEAGSSTRRTTPPSRCASACPSAWSASASG